jgi:predicted HTH domain antitoxin
MRAVVLTMPDTEISPTFDVSVYLAGKMYEDGLLSSGQAASLANLSKRAFIEVMGKYGVSPFGSKIEDLAEDIANA